MAISFSRINASIGIIHTTYTDLSLLQGNNMLKSTTTAVVVLLLAGSVLAEEKKVLPPADEQGWIPLFDGTSLTNWGLTNFGGEGEVLAADGVLTMKMGEPLTGVTWKGAELPKVNYEISLEAQRVQGGDFFCAMTVPVKENACSLVLGGWGGSVTGISSINGFDASENETTDYFAFKNEQWYKIRMRVTETTIQAWLDEAELANVDYADKKISVRIEVELSRPLGLSTFQTEGQIRNFKIRKLTPADDEVAKETKTK